MLDEVHDFSGRKSTLSRELSMAERCVFAMEIAPGIMLDPPTVRGFTSEERWAP